MGGVTSAGMRRRLLVLALTSTFALVGCGSDDAESRPVPTELRVGLVANSLGHPTRPGQIQDAALETGVRRLREEVQWSSVEPRPGVRAWRVPDRLFAAAARRGIRLLPLLTDAPRWAVPSDGGLPTASDAYASFVRDAVDRYGRDGTFWRERPRLRRSLAPRWFELWNEPYFVKEPPDVGEYHPANAERYAALAGDAIAATRRDARDVRFLLSAATVSSTRPDDDDAWLDALELARPGLLREADAFAAHPYGIVQEGFRPLDDLFDALDERGLEQPVWITEIGWSTCRGEEVCVSEEDQADNMAALFDGLAADYRDTVKAVFVYHLYDWRVQPRGGREGAYGLVRVGGSHKPAFSVLRRYARVARG